MKNGRLETTIVPDQWVRQGSGEWYYQRIIEIHEAGDKELALDIFEAAKSGNAQSVIIKSGPEMDPFLTENTAEVMRFLRNAKLPWN